MKQPVKASILCGQLRHRITLMRPAESRDGYADSLDAPEAVATVPACVEVLTGNELWNAQQVTPLLSHRVTIRYRSGIDPTWWLIYRGRRLNIHAALNVGERNHELQLLCTEKVIPETPLPVV